MCYAASLRGESPSLVELKATTESLVELKATTESPVYYTLVVPNEGSYSVKFDNKYNVWSLKQKIASSFGIPFSRQRIVWKGQILEDTRLMTDIGTSETINLEFK